MILFIYKTYHFLATMTHNWTKTIITNTKMTKNLKIKNKKYYQWLCICRNFKIIYDI